MVVRLRTSPTQLRNLRHPSSILSATSSVRPPHHRLGHFLLPTMISRSSGTESPTAIPADNSSLWSTNRLLNSDGLDDAAHAPPASQHTLRQPTQRMLRSIIGFLTTPLSSSQPDLRVRLPRCFCKQVSPSTLTLLASP